MGGFSSRCLEDMQRKTDGGAEGISTYCSVENKDDGPPYMQKDVLLW